MSLPDAADFLARRAVSTRLGTTAGASSFFSPPARTLDPALFFDGTMQLRPDVRNWITHTLYRYWSRYFQHAKFWSRVWLAGSGITYQWNAARSVGEPGDLDVLVGVDFPAFWAANPDFYGLGEAATAEMLNDHFRAGLDKETDRANINGTVYEVTFYCNPHATDIRDINPYAAYDVTHDHWTVTPPELPADWAPERVLPQSWWTQFAQDSANGQAALAETRHYIEQLHQLRPGDPHWVNAATGLHDAIRRGKALFDEIHEGRHAAFTPTGGGYTGYANVRWQTAKRSGIVQSLHQLKDLWSTAHADAEACIYRGTVLDAQHALTMASLVGAGRG